MEEKLTQMKETIGTLLHSLNLELFDIVYSGNARNGVLRVFIDRPGGVKLEDCEKASRNISPLLDAYDFIDHHYTLEVSSPGLDRPLRTVSELRREVGKLVFVKTKKPVEFQNVLVGRLISVDESGNITILLDEKKGSVAEVSFENISESRLEVEW